MKLLSIRRYAAETTLRALALGSLTALWVGPVPALAAEISFPVSSGSGAVKVEWQGNEQARAGQPYEYTLQVSNDSDHPVHEVMVHQMVPSSLEIRDTRPQTVDSPRPRAMRLDRQRRMRGEKSTESRAPEDRQDRDPAPTRDRWERMENSADDQMNRDPGESQARRERGNRGQQARQADRERRQARAGQADDARDSAGKKISWRIGSLDPGESKTISVDARAGHEGQLETCLWVDFKPTLCQTIEIVAPDLELTQRLFDSGGNERDIFYACENVVARYELTNPGSGRTRDATIEIDMPSGFRPAGDSGESLQVGPLDPGETVTREIRFEPTRTGEFHLSATASTGELEASSEQARIDIVRPELEVAVRAPDTAYLGRRVTYEVTVTNASEVPALDTRVTFPVRGSGLHFASTGDRIGDDTETYAVGDLDGGESKSFAITFDPAEAREIETTATATAYCAEKVAREVTTQVKGIPALEIYVVDSQDPVRIGEETVYELQVRNEGTGRDVDIELAAELPDSLELVSSDGDTMVEDEDQTLRFGKIKSLGPGEIRRWNIRVKGTAEGRDVFKVNLSSESIDDLSSSEPTTVY